MKNFTKQEILELYGQVTLGEISFSRMVEIMNELVSEAAYIHEEPKKGDLAIFWDNNKRYAVIKLYERLKGSEEWYYKHEDNSGSSWRNAIKFESREQYEKLLKGEL